MKQTEYLHQLIQSLTKTEKRYFKMFSSVNSRDKNYIRLFDLMNKQEVYNEQEVIEKLNDPKATKHFPVLKKYLSDQVLRSLRNFNSGESIDIQVQSQLIDIEVLFRKGLVRQCSKLIRKARELAVKHERFGLALAAISWERKLFIFHNDQLRSEEEITREEERIIEQNQNVLQYHRLFSQSWALFEKTGYIQTEPGVQEAKKLLKSSLLKSREHAFTLKSSIYFELIHANCYKTIGDYKKAYIHSKKATEYPTHTLNEYEFYAMYLTHLEACSDLAKLDECLHCIEVLKYSSTSKILDRVRIIERDLNINLMTIEQLVYVDTGRLEELKQWADNIEATFEEMAISQSTGKLHALRYSLLQAWFHLGNDRKALKWANEILNSSVKEQRLDLQENVRIMYVLLQAGRRNYELLNSTLKSTIRFVNAHQLMGPLEQCMFDFFKELVKTNDPKAEKALFRQIHQDLLKIQESIEEGRSSVKLFFLLSWVESQLQEVTFHERYRANFKTFFTESEF